MAQIPNKQELRNLRSILQFQGLVPFHRWKQQDVQKIPHPPANVS